MCCLEDIANWATIWGAMVATATFIFTILTYKKASSIDNIVSQKKELFDALERLRDYVISLRRNSDDYVEIKAFERLLLQCQETQKILIENKYSAGKSWEQIQEIIRDIEDVISKWEDSKEEEKDLNEVATNLMNKYFSEAFNDTIKQIQDLLRW